MAPAIPQRDPYAAPYPRLERPTPPRTGPFFDAKDENRITSIDRTHHTGDSTTHIGTGMPSAGRIQEEVREQLPASSGFPIGDTGPEGRGDPRARRRPNRGIHPGYAEPRV